MGLLAVWTLHSQGERGLATVAVGSAPVAPAMPQVVHLGGGGRVKSLGNRWGDDEGARAGVVRVSVQPMAAECLSISAPLTMTKSIQTKYSPGFKPRR